MTVLKELSKYKLNLVGVQGITWHRDGSELTGKYAFFFC
jgi:hypothetical protein